MLENELHRRDVGEFWGVDPEFFPQQRGMCMTDIFPAIESGQIKALWLVATNPMTSMPNTARIRKTLEKLEFCVVQDSYADVEANQYAHAFLPASIWAEKEGCFSAWPARHASDCRGVAREHGSSPWRAEPKASPGHRRTRPRRTD